MNAIARRTPILAGQPRASFHVDPGTGRRWWAFSGPGGRTVVEPETPALAEGLGAVRMGELVVDDKAARELLDRITQMNGRVAIARDVARLYPLEAGRHGLPAAITEWTADFDRNRAVVDRLKATAQRAIILRTWGSASDADLEVLGRLEEGAISLEERAHTVEAAAKPAAGTRPPIPSPVTEPEAGAISTLGWIGIGAGVLAALGLVSLLISGAARASMSGEALGAREPSRWLKHALRRINATKSLKELMDEYRRMSAYIDEHGAPGEAQKLWQAYYDRIGAV